MHPQRQKNSCTGESKEDDTDGAAFRPHRIFKDEGDSAKLRLVAKNRSRHRRTSIRCAETRNNPSKTKVHPWENATAPWQRVHIDYAGPFHGVHIFVLVDAHTKWIEAIPTKSTTAAKTLEMLGDIFARFGLPYTLVSDNGSNFKSREFEDFLRSNGIMHKVTAPYHPSTNGQAERYIQTIKRSLCGQLKDGVSLQEGLQTFLLQYRKTPHPVTGVSPAELMLGRPIRSRIDLVKKKLTTLHAAEDKMLEDRKERSLEPQQKMFQSHIHRYKWWRTLRSYQTEPPFLQPTQYSNDHHHPDVQLKPGTRPHD